MKATYYLLTLTLFFTLGSAFAQPEEDDFYKIVTLPVPEGMLLEVGGVTTLPDGRVALCTRRGDVWIVEDPYLETGSFPTYTLFASGLHEPLGLAYYQNALYSAQRGELTKLVDTDGDDRADVYETVYSWELSGNYHEYSYGPKITEDGTMYVTTNLAFGNNWWRPESRFPWRGWTMKIAQDGSMEPWATGMRSPCGIGLIDGEFFYADNQGDWVGSGAIWHVTKGSFTGHPAGLRWTGLSGSPVETTQDDFYKAFDERKVFNKEGQPIKPENIPFESNPLTMAKAREEFPELRLPAVWLPHAILGISNSEMLKDETNGAFGPFGGQIFIGDQGQSKVMRVALEKVNGQFQGVAFDFKRGFQSGILRMDWGHDGSLFVGETNRGWGSAGNKNSGFERLLWLGRDPFEMKTVRAMPDGFEITFTKPVNKESAATLDSYSGKQFTYKYHPVYGSPTINNEALKISGLNVSEDGLKVRLVVDNLKETYIHEINVSGVRSAEEDWPVLHPTAFYTLNNIPDGDKLSVSEYSSSLKDPVATKTADKVAQKVPSPQQEVLTYEQVKPLLDRNTCSACHQVSQKVVGPSFQDIAKRKYTDKRIVELIYNPEPENWPNYATPMAPMPQVPEDEALKIAAWINSLRSAD